MVPLFVLMMSIDHVVAYVLAYLVFTAASVTDYLDGKIARERGLVTNFGTLLDPLADKVLLAAAFVMLMDVPTLHIPGWTIVAILAREFLVTGARSLAAKDGKILAANSWGKIKTILQMVYIYTFLFLLIAGELLEMWAPGKIEFYPALLATLSLWAIIAVSMYTVLTGIQFAKANWEELSLGSRI